MTTKWIFECFVGELLCASALPLVIFCGDFSRKGSWIMDETHSQSCGPHYFSKCTDYSCVLRLSLSHLLGISVFTLANLCQGSCESKRLFSLRDMGESNTATRILLYIFHCVSFFLYVLGPLLQFYLETGRVNVLNNFRWERQPLINFSKIASEFLRRLNFFSI